MSFVASAEKGLEQDKTTQTVNFAAGATAQIVLAFVFTNTLSVSTLPTNIAVTCDGVAMNLIGTKQSTKISVSAFYLYNPPVGAVNYISSWTNSNRRCNTLIMSYTENLYLSASYIDESSGGGTGTSESLIVPSAAGQMVIDAHAHLAAEAVAVGAGQTERNDTLALSTNTHASEEVATAATTTMSNTWVTNESFSHLAFALTVDNAQPVFW